jgi:uncharacterized protein YdeI (YjbR/CyaY-like superfamily)
LTSSSNWTPSPGSCECRKDLAGALDKETRAAFDRMSYTHRREYVEWIDEAKREDTRRRRIAKAVELIGAGKPYR